VLKGLKGGRDLFQKSRDKREGLLLKKRDEREGLLREERQEGLVKENAI